MKLGEQSQKITETIEKIVHSFGFKTLRGVLIHSLDRDVLDGSKVIQTNSEPEDKVENFEID